MPLSALNITLQIIFIIRMHIIFTGICFCSPSTESDVDFAAMSHLASLTDQLQPPFFLKNGTHIDLLLWLFPYSYPSLTHEIVRLSVNNHQNKLVSILGHNCHY